MAQKAQFLSWDSSYGEVYRQGLSIEALAASLCLRVFSHAADRGENRNGNIIAHSKFRHIHAANTDPFPLLNLRTAIDTIRNLYKKRSIFIISCGKRDTLHRHTKGFLFSFLVYLTRCFALHCQVSCDTHGYLSVGNPARISNDARRMTSQLLQ